VTQPEQHTSPLPTERPTLGLYAPEACERDVLVQHARGFDVLVHRTQDALEAAQKKGEVFAGLNSPPEHLILWGLRTQKVWKKPCELRELKQALHDLSLSFERRIILGSLVFFPAQQLVQSDREWRHLTFAETQLLNILAQEKGGSLSKHHLLKTIWNVSAEIETRTLEEHVYRLRRKIEPTPASPIFLLSTPGGYALRIERREKFPYKRKKDQ